MNCKSNLEADVISRVPEAQGGRVRLPHTAIWGLRKAMVSRVHNLTSIIRLLLSYTARTEAHCTLCLGWRRRLPLVALYEDQVTIVVS